jgi:hypothetical protein
VRDISLRDVWHGSAVRQEAADIATEANSRLAGAEPALREFSFCPGIAYQATRDPLAVTDELAERARLVHEIRTEVTGHDH